MKPQKSVDFNNYKMKILKKLMEICLITETEALLTMVNPEGKYIIFLQQKMQKYLLVNI